MRSVYHHYSKIYSKNLFPIISEQNMIIVEIGILTGIDLVCVV